MIKKISLAVSAILIVIMAVFFVKQEQEQKERAERAEKLNQKVGEYENQIHDIEADLNTRKAALQEGGDKSGSLCVSAKVRTLDELMQVSLWMEGYNYPLTVILDVDLDETQKDMILGEVVLHKNWSVVLTGNTEDWPQRASAVRENLVARGIADTAVAYFNEQATDEQKEWLQSSGWNAYSDSIGNAEEVNTLLSDDELPQISHVALTEQNTLGTVAKSAMSKSVPFILVIEMENMNITFTPETVTRILAKFRDEYTGPGNLSAISFSEYMEEYKMNRDARIQAKNEYKAYEEGRRKEIENLKKEVRQLYDTID